MRNLLARLLPLDRIVALALRFGLLRKPLELAAKAYQKAQGIRTQANLGLAAAVLLGAILGYVPWDTAKAFALPLLGAAVPSFLDKVNRLLPLIQRGAETVADEAVRTSNPGDGSQSRGS